MNWEAIQYWFFGLGENYGVNPLIFGAIYVSAIPFFSLSIGWLIQNYRKGKSVVLPALSAMFFFISAYLYLILAGKNVPFWVYGAVVAMILLGAYSTLKKIRKQIKEV
jgi:ABC-type Co2+ transport system permease subunit